MLKTIDTDVNERERKAESQDFLSDSRFYLWNKRFRDALGTNKSKARKWYKNKTDELADDRR